MTKQMKEDISAWVGLGWEYQIIHKMTLRKYGYDLRREELRAVKDELAVLNASKKYNLA